MDAGGWFPGFIWEETTCCEETLMLVSSYIQREEACVFFEVQNSKLLHVHRNNVWMSERCAKDININECHRRALGWCRVLGTGPGLPTYLAPFIPLSDSSELLLVLCPSAGAVVPLLSVASTQVTWVFDVTVQQWWPNNGMNWGIFINNTIWGIFVLFCVRCQSNTVQSL